MLLEAVRFCCMNNAPVPTLLSPLPSNNPLRRFFHGLWDTRHEESNVHFDLFRFIPSHNGLRALRPRGTCCFLIFFFGEIIKIRNITLVHYKLVPKAPSGSLEDMWYTSHDAGLVLQHQSFLHPQWNTSSLRHPGNFCRIMRVERRPQYLRASSQITFPSITIAPGR